MSQQALPPPNTARLAITSFCNLLHYYGISTLEPEMVRQAKFDGPVAAALWRVLHDVVLIVMAGCPPGPGCQAALSRQWSQISLELSGSDEAEFPYEGAALVLHQLATWDAPAGLIRALAPGTAELQNRRNVDSASDPDLDQKALLRSATSWPRSCRSRPLLLALGWLAAASGLFERRITELEPGPELRVLLPPYPQDACVSPAVQMAYETAAREAQEHVQKLPVGCSAAGTVAAAAFAASVPAASVVDGSSGRARGRGGGGGGAVDVSGCGPTSAEALWVDVETAAQRAVALCGRARIRLMALQAATDCRNRLAHSLWSRQAAAAPASRPLTPYELQLCAQSSNMQRHISALETATLMLLEQQELAAHGALFFEWLGSVLEEEQQSGGAAGSGRRAARGGADAARQKAASRSGGASDGSKEHPLASLEQLPYIGSEAGVRLAAYLDAQFEAAVQAAEAELSTARLRTAPEPVRQDVDGAAAKRTTTTTTTGCSQHQNLQSKSFTMEHFLTLAEQAIREPLMPVGEVWCAESAMVEGSSNDWSEGTSIGLPLLCGGDGGGDGDSPGPWSLPDDVAAAMATAQITEQRRRSAAEEEETRFRQLQYGALARYEFGGASASTATVTATPALLGPPAMRAVGGPAVAAAMETQRILEVVLVTARPLARTRASHKAAFMAALRELPEGYFVSGL